MLVKMCALLAICLCHAAVAQTEPLTLQQAVAIALERNPRHKAALAEVRMAAAGVREARSGYLPRLNFSETAVRGNDPVFVFGTRLRQTRFTAADFGLNRLNTPAPIGNFSTRFGLQWNIFDSFATSAAVRRSADEKEASNQRLDRDSQTVIFRVVQSYFGALFAARQLELSRHAVSTAQSAVDQSRARFEAGSTVESDYLAAQVNLASREQELVRAQNALALAGAQLDTALGVTPEREYQLAEPPEEKSFPSPDLAEAEAHALKENPQLKEAAAQVAASEAGIGTAKSAFGPRLNIFAASELDNVSPFANGGNNWTAGAELQLDLFTGGQKSARLARERAGADQAKALRQVAQDNVRLEVRRAWYDYDTARRLLAVSRSAVAQAEEATRIVSNRYEGGLITITELLRSQDAERSARNAWWESVYRLSVSYAALELATGSLTPLSPVVMP